MNKAINSDYYSFMIGGKLTKEEVKYASELIAIAKEDLHAASILFKKRFYRQAVFLLEQNVEKVAKADAVLKKEITVTEAKKLVGHKFYKLKYISYASFLRKFGTKMLGMMPEKVKTEISELLWFANHKNQERLAMHFAKMPKTEILELIDGVKRQRELDNSQRKEDSSKSNFITYQVLFDKRYKRDLSKCVITTGLELYYLGLILSPHCEFARYPNNLIIYNENLGIIQAYPKLEKRLKRLTVLVDPKYRPASKFF